MNAYTRKHTRTRSHMHTHEQIDGPRPNMGGDDNGRQAAGGGVDSVLNEGLPVEVSSRVLHFYLLQQTLKDAIKEERYYDASALKLKLDKLRSRLMRRFENKVMQQVEWMFVRFLFFCCSLFRLAGWLPVFFPLVHTDACESRNVKLIETGSPSGKDNLQIYGFSGTGACIVKWV